MSMQTEACGAYAAQARRFACDRCHKHKLRCERAPILAGGNLVLLPLGTCKRCEKAGAQCQTTTTTTGDNANSNTTAAAATATTNSSSIAKRKTPPVEMEDTDSDRASRSTPSHSSVENDIAMFSHSPFGLSPGDPLMFSTDASNMLDLSTLDNDVGNFRGLEAMPAPTAPSMPFQYPGNIMCPPQAHEGGPKGSIDAAYDASVSSTSLSTSSRSSASTTAPTSHSYPLSHDEQDERKRLLHLHTLIFDGLHHIIESDLANSFFSPGNMTPPSRNGENPPSDIVGRVLVTSERFLELFDILREKLSLEAANPRCRDNGGTQRTMSSIAASRYKSPSPAQSTSGLLRRQIYSMPDGVAERRLEGERTRPFSAPPSRTVSLPVIISFLTCHVGLLSVYRTIFFHIQEMLRSADTSPLFPTTRSGPQPKRVIPCQVDGNTFNHEQILKIRIQLEIMTHMLDRIARAWAEFLTDARRDDGDTNGESAGSSNKAATLSLMQHMLIHEGFDCRNEGFDIGLGSLEVTLKSIRGMLRGERFS